MVQIGAKLLATYFITLPILLGIHTIQHQHDWIEDLDDGLTYTQLTPDCSLCDLHHSETAIIETPFFYAVDLYLIPIQSLFIENIVEASRELSFLRGPPTV